MRPGISFKIQQKTVEPTKQLVEQVGVVALPFNLDSGVSNQVISVTQATDFVATFGYALDNPKLKPLKLLLENAKEVLVYITATNTASTGKIGECTLTSKIPGTIGNSMTVTTELVESLHSFEVKIGEVVVEEFMEGAESKFITYKGTVSPGTATLESGSSQTASASNIAKFIEAIEPYNADIIVSEYNVTSSPLLKAYVERARNELNYNVKLVSSKYDNANSEAVISVANSFVDTSNNPLTVEEATYWVAGLMASTKYNQSLTMTVIPASSPVPYMNDKAVNEALTKGHLVFTVHNRKTVIEKDINTLIAPDEESIEYLLSKNRVGRAIGFIKEQISDIFYSKYCGKLSNTPITIGLFKTDIGSLLKQLEAEDAIQNVDVLNDISISITGVDSAECTLSIQPVDALEKLNVSINLR